MIMSYDKRDQVIDTYDEHTHNSFFTIFIVLSVLMSFTFIALVIEYYLREKMSVNEKKQRYF